MRTIFILLFVILAFVAGCHMLQNLTVDDIRNTKYFYREYTLDVSICEINKSLYAHASSCRPICNFKVNPENGHEAIITIGMTGFTDTSITFVMDFKENPQTSKTTIRAYSYHAGWRKYGDRVIRAIQNPGDCN